MSEITAAEEALFAELKADGIEVNAATINKAKQGDGYSLWSIGYIYHDKKDYSKAMTWYRLSADKNHSYSQYHIGLMFYNEEGVSADYLLAMEWFIKAAKQHHKQACSSIGDLFEKGQGVPVNKYKALEWYCKVRKNAAGVTTLNKQGFHLIKQDENKSMEQLVRETEEIINAQKQKGKNKSNCSIKEEDNSRSGSISSQSNTTQGELQLETEVETTDGDDGSEAEKRISLENDMLVFQMVNRQKQQEIDSLKKELKNYKKEAQNMEKVIHILRERNFMFGQQLEAKDETIHSLENELCVLSTAPSIPQTAEDGFNQTAKKHYPFNNPFHQLEEKDSIINLLKQEIQTIKAIQQNDRQENKEQTDTLKELLRSKRIELKLLKQNMDLTMYKAKQEKRKLESENRRLKFEIREYDIFIQTGNTINESDEYSTDDDDDDDNETDDKAEIDSYTNDNGITDSCALNNDKENMDNKNGKDDVDDVNSTVCKIGNKKRKI